jgi:L-ascorbate metabolism protein UlaG (beta-lactamase superfamily)
VSEKLSKEAFSESLNTRFRIPTQSSDALELKLMEVVETMRTPTREQFSVLFSGPLEYHLPQGIYHMEHEKMGEMDIFLVPIGKGPEGYNYEAVFNRVIEEG